MAEPRRHLHEPACSTVREQGSEQLGSACPRPPSLGRPGCHRAAWCKKRGRMPREGQRRYGESEYPVSSCAMQRGVILLRPSAVRVSTCFFKRFWQRKETDERKRVSTCEQARPARKRGSAPHVAAFRVQPDRASGSGRVGQRLQQPLASTSTAYLTGPPDSEQVPGQPHTRKHRLHAESPTGRALISSL